VRDHVAVGVAGQARLAREVDPGEHERDSVGEAVRVDAETDTELTHPSGSWRAWRPSKTATVS
jgi:hypothetical protein